MFLPLPIPRFHLFEIDDQPWFPPRLRRSVQAVLTKFWEFHLPPLQAAAPAALAARKLLSTLPHITSYTFVDFCSGAGGPTPFIAHEINSKLREEERGRHGQLNGLAKGEGDGVEVVLTDLHPHAQAWREASARSEGGWLGFVDGSVDAARAGKEVLRRVTWSGRNTELRGLNGEEKKLFRLFSLAFHHFDDELARNILRNTLRNSDGFAIFELQGRDVGNLFIVLAMLPVLLANSWWWFWGDWWHLFFTYIVPIVPFVVVYDGLVSCLRTRREKEVFALLRKASAGIEGGLEGWRF